MLTAIRAIGRWQRKGKTELATLIQDPFKGKEGKVLFIKIDLDTNKFAGVDIEDFDRGKLEKYLYRRSSSNGPNFTPAAVITEVSKTFKNRILGFFKRQSQFGTNKLYEKIRSLVVDNQKTIVHEIENMDKGIAPKQKEGKLLTLKIKQANQWRYLGDFDLFKDLLINGAKRQTRKAAVREGMCCLCGEKKEVSGAPRVFFKFYTVDKPGFVAGGFDKESAWKNFPLCYDCELDLVEGRKFIEKEMSFKFYGLNYLLIPNPILGDIARSEIIDILASSRKNISLEKQVEKRITDDEREILYALAQKKDILTVNFLFLQKKAGSSAERILLLIEDIFPSRIRQIFDAKKYVEQLFNQEFRFHAIRTFFGKSSPEKGEYDLNEDFLKIVDSVFKGRPIETDFIFRFYMPVIRNEFIKEGHFKQRVLDALMGLLFFLKLGLISFKEAENMTTSIFDPFFQQYASIFQHPAKKGIFLLGVLTQLLLNKQYSDRGASPFRKYLKGLKMDELDLRELLPKVQNKLEEYDSFDKGKQQIAAEASRFLLEAGEDWRIPVGELNFYFACGMNLAQDVAKIVYNKTEEMEL